ncbi:hypothetical protein BaRGS_00022796 [Batillaria attramentaria]|uniref:Uncharacterized protein n=1 Tax=Batillaria attramentaria TaxID=370345 RepID=A0ABD0KG13_9CAEN
MHNMASCLCLRRLLPRAALSALFQTHGHVNRKCIRAIHTHLLKGQVVNIGCASGFWGDTAVAAPQLIYGAKVDYIVFDYLSEITMSLLTAAKHKNPDLGYAPDFVSVSMAPFIRDIKKRGIKIISNAGGVNPSGCARALQQACREAGVELNIAVVSGDDLMPQAGVLMKQGITDMSSGESFPENIHSMNAYLGAGPIVRALDLGADVVITGRCVDSALVLGPLIHQFGWTMDQHDLLAAGSLAGHLIECGAQATGGIFTDWHTVQDWDNIGFPVVQCGDDGQFVLTKPPGTGGLVSWGTVSEQLLYEVGNPALYFLPDVVCDFTNVQIEELPKDAVFVTGARGSPPSGEYKVSSTHLHGFRSTVVATVGGVRAKEKAEKTAKAILKRCQRIFHQLNFDDFTDVNIEVLGTEHMYGPHARIQDPREVMMWLAVTHSQKKALEFFAREIAPAGTGMAPGLCGIVGGRPKVSPVLRLFSFLYPKSNVQVDLEMNGEFVETYTAPSAPTAEYLTRAYPPANGQGKDSSEQLPTGPCTFRVEDLAYTRSGDKGNEANIGVIARHPVYLPYLRQALTAEAVETYFAHLFENTNGTNVERFDVPGINAMNFLLHKALGGGGIASLRSDPQGKALGQQLLDFEITNVPDLPSLVQSS